MCKPCRQTSSSGILTAHPRAASSPLQLLAIKALGVLEGSRVWGAQDDQLLHNLQADRKRMWGDAAATGVDGKWQQVQQPESVGNQPYRLHHCALKPLSECARRPV